MAEGEITWSAPEFPHYEKSLVWSSVIIILGILLIGFSLWQKNFLVAIIALVGGALVLYWGHRKPDILSFSLTEERLDISDRKLYPLDNFLGFAILNDPDQEGMDELILEQESTLNTHLKISIPTDMREEIETLLEQHLPEVEYEESAIESVARWLRF